MAKQLFDEIIGKFGKAWADQKPDEVMDLITHEGLQYFESTFDEPTMNWDKVSELWRVVPENQKDITWWHEILVCDQHMALAHVRVTRTMVPSGESQNIDAAFLFGFDDDGKINYFRQWRMLK